MKKTKEQKRQRRKIRIRSRITGTGEMPRLTVFRSLSAIEAQLIDDAKGVTLAGATSLKDKNGKSTAAAKKTGMLLAEKAKALKITKCVFDRNGYAYHGRVKALADGAREGGLLF